MRSANQIKKISVGRTHQLQQQQIEEQHEAMKDQQQQIADMQITLKKLLEPIIEEAEACFLYGTRPR